MGNGVEHLTPCRMRVGNKMSWHSPSEICGGGNLYPGILDTGNSDFHAYFLRAFADITRDWSDHALWWPEKRRWLTHTRSTLDQVGVTAETRIEFTPMHKMARSVIHLHAFIILAVSGKMGEIRDFRMAKISPVFQRSIAGSTDARCPLGFFGHRRQSDSAALPRTRYNIPPPPLFSRERTIRPFRNSLFRRAIAQTLHPTRNSTQGSRLRGRSGWSAADSTRRGTERGWNSFFATITSSYIC